MMYNNRSSTSLEDLTSLSSISSISSSESSIHSGNCSTVSSCNESHTNENKSLPQFNCDLENISTSSSPTVAQSPSSSSSSLSALINQRLRQKMISLNIQPENLKKKFKKVTFNSEQRDGRTVDIVREISEKKSISHKVPVQSMDTTEVNKVAAHKVAKSDRRQSTKSVAEPITVNQSDISSISSIEVSPSTIRQFKLMIEKQKSYLDCLQRELNRLQRMEDVLSELHYKSELQKRVMDDLSYLNCHEGSSADCFCQSPSQKDNQSHQEVHLKDNPEPSRTHEPLDDLSNSSTVESVVSVVTPIDQTNYSTLPVDRPQSTNRVTPKRGSIHSIHARIDKIINELHEETVTKHSIGVQTSDSIIEPTKPYHSPSSKTRKSAKNEFTVASSNSESQEKCVAWNIIIPREDPVEMSKTRNTRGQDYYLEDASDITLQQAFRSRCSHFQARSQARVRQINVASAIRKATAESRLERQLEEFLMRNQLPRRDYSFLNGYRPTKVKEIKPRKMFTEKEMRQQTERLYSDLPEIKKRKEEKRREENVKTHRMMAKNFSQKLKCKAVEGRTTFPLTQRLTNY